MLHLAYILPNQNYIAWNPTTLVVTAGTTDGRTIITCYKATPKYVNSKMITAVWQLIKFYK